MRSAQNPQPNEIETPFNLLRNLVVISIIAEAAALIASIVGNLNKQYLTINGYVLLATAISLIFLLRGVLLPAQILLPTSLFVGASYVIIFPGNGLHDINLLVYAVVISLAGLTLGERGAFVFTFLIILTIFGIGIAEISGVLISETSSLTALITPIVASIIVLTIAFIQRALINLLGESAKRARASEREVIERNNELQTFSAGLENLVQMRTSELERANQYNERRAKQFEAIGQVSRAINQT